MRDEKQSSDILCVPDGERSWVVLHARPRCEKKAADHCDRNEVPWYLPLKKKTHRYGSRERSFWSPLFPGYVFCVVTPDQKSEVRQNRYVANLLEVLDQEKLVEQLRHINRALTMGDVVEVMPYLETGRRVRVTGGVMKGLEGIVSKVKGKTRVIISVDMIRQSVAVEVDGAWLAPA
jgi:transcription antitermination factor NusG